MWSFRGASGPDVALDLGSTRLRLGDRQGRVIDRPSVLAQRSDADGRKVVAVFEDALQLLGRAPAGTTMVQPIRAGRVDAYDGVRVLVEAALTQVGAVGKAHVLVGIPHGAPETERRALQDVLKQAGAADVTLVSSIVAAAAGAELPLGEAHGAMIVDIGGGRTDVAVVSLGGTVVRRDVQTAGERLDERIAQWLRKQHHMMVGLATANRIKHDVGAVRPGGRTLQTRVRGRDLSSGAPRQLDLRSDDLVPVLGDAIEPVRNAVREVLRETPPELSADIHASGVLLVGGGARLRELDGILRDATGLPFLTIDHPEHAVLRGLRRLMDDPRLLDLAAPAAR